MGFEWLRRSVTRKPASRARRANFDQSEPKGTFDIAPFVAFQEAIQSKSINTVVEFGTAQAVPGRSTHSFALFPGLDRSQYTMVDIKSGDDVDVVADIHALPAEWTNRFDICIAGAVFEHLERPWIAAKEVARILAPGGLCYVLTHQTFPLHGFPSDFFRFSTDALALIFSDAGLEVLNVGYAGRTSIIAPPEIVPAEIIDIWNEQSPSYALVAVLARKSA